MFFLRHCAVLVLIVCLLVDSYAFTLVNLLGSETLAIEGNLVPRPEQRRAYVIDISQLDWLMQLSDHQRPANLPGVEFLENGVPLERGTLHEHIRDRGGLFSHWQGMLLFSPSDAIEITQARYELRYPAALRSSLVSWIISYRMMLVLAVLALSGFEIARHTFGLSIVMFSGLCVAVLPTIAADWNVARCFPDSKSYIGDYMRPPVYPLLIRLTASRLTIHHCRDDGSIDPTAGAVQVVRAQKILLLIGWLVFLIGFAYTARWGAALAGVLAYCLLRFGWLEPEPQSHIMSETLAVALLLAFSGIALVAIRNPNSWWIPVASLTFGLAVLTRLSAAFGIIVFAAVAMVQIWKHRQQLKALAAPIAVAGLIGISCIVICVLHSRARAGITALNPLQNYERIAWAMELGTPEDGMHIQDPEARMVFERSLAHRATLEKGRGTQSVHPLQTFDLNFQVWAVANPVAFICYTELAKEGKLTPLPAGIEQPLSNPLFPTFANRVFGEIASSVLPRHRSEQFAIIGRSLEAAIYRGTQVQLPGLSLPTILLIALVCCLFGWCREGVIGLAFLASYILALVGICSVELPLPRYLAFAEWFALIGLFFAGLAAIRGLARLPRWFTRRPQIVPSTSIEASQPVASGV